MALKESCTQLHSSHDLQKPAKSDMLRNQAASWILHEPNSSDEVDEQQEEADPWSQSHVYSVPSWVFQGYGDLQSTTNHEASDRDTILLDDFTLGTLSSPMGRRWVRRLVPLFMKIQDEQQTPRVQMKSSGAPSSTVAIASLGWASDWQGLWFQGFEPARTGDHTEQRAHTQHLG